VEGPALPLAVDLERVGGEVGSLACSLRQVMALVPLALGYSLSRHAGASWGVGVGVGLKGACPAKTQQCPNAGGPHRSPTDRLAETVWTFRILAGVRSAWGIAARQRCSNANSAVAPRRRSQPARIHLFSSSGSRRASTAGGRSARAPAAPPANDQPANSPGTRFGCRHGLEETSRMVGQRLQFWPLRGRCRPHHTGSKGAPA
jgi:hypothetical protein